MDLGLAGKTALITGASAGLGYGCAEALAREGVRVVVVSRSEERVRAAAQRIGHDAVALAADVSEPTDAAAVVRDAEALVGPIDILIANAGGPPPGTFETTPLEAYEPALRLSMLSTIAMCQEAVPGMRARRWGRIVAVTSIAVREPIGMLILSNTARSGLTGFLKTLAREIAADGVTVNSLQPGLHDTDRVRSLHGGETNAVAEGVPAGVLGDAADFGRVAAFVCSDSAKFLTGAAIPIDGGASHGLQ